MFSISKTFTKTVKSILSGKEAVKTGNYSLPQFGVSPAKDATAKYTDEEAIGAFQEALAYFGADAVVRFLNNSIVVKAQKRANNDLRAASSGLSALDQALVDTLLRNSKSSADLECQAADENGKLLPVDRKSNEWLEAFRDALRNSLKGKKVAHLSPVFEDAAASTVEFDLTVPGSLNGDTDDAPEETSAA